MDELKAKIGEAIAGMTDAEIDEAIGMSKHAGKCTAADLKKAAGGGTD